MYRRFGEPILAEILKIRSPLELSLREITDLHLRVHGFDQGVSKKCYEIWIGKEGQRKGTEIYLQVAANGKLRFSDRLGLFAEFTPSKEKQFSIAYMKA